MPSNPLLVRGLFQLFFNLLHGILCFQQVSALPLVLALELLHLPPERRLRLVGGHILDFSVHLSALHLARLPGFLSKAKALLERESARIWIRAFEDSVVFHPLDWNGFDLLSIDSLYTP